MNVNLGHLAWLAGFICVQAAAQQVLPLWPDGVPGSKGEGPGHEPSLTLFLLPDTGTPRPAVVVCPGGGYGGLAFDYEGIHVAAWFNQHGVAAAVLRYRHGPHYQHPAPLQDAQRAMQTLRMNAAEWNIDPDRVGILGFSAGGHLAATASTQWNSGDGQGHSSRPDFSILLYPVITMTGPHTHDGSRKNLLGENPDPELINALSAEKQVRSHTPPAFLVHTTEDRLVPVQNSLLYYQALVENGIPAELHVFEKGRHGLGLGAPGTPFAEWPALCLQWLQGLDVLP